MDELMGGKQLSEQQCTLIIGHLRKWWRMSHTNASCRNRRLCIRKHNGTYRSTFKIH